MSRRELLLQVEGLKICFPTPDGLVKAVDGIDFRLHRGETLGIVGESGSGKSVTALSLMRLLPRSAGLVREGRILFHPPGGAPVDLARLPESDMRAFRGNRLGMIFQEPMSSLNPVFRCGEQVSEAIRLHQGIPKKKAAGRVLELFERVRLPDPLRIYRAYPHQLSGGQRQRVMIAMAMSCHPDILIADEPTTALDVTVQKAILDLMNELKTELDAAIIFISHDLGVIGEIADRVMVMKEGQIVEEEPVAALFSRPQHPYTIGLMACRPGTKHRMRRLPVVSDFLSAEEGNRTPQEIKAFLHSLHTSPEESAARIGKLKQSAPLLEVEELHTWFPGRRSLPGRPRKDVKAVNGVSFEVFPGETLGLVGESGSGKTTLGRSILRLVEPRSGAIRFQGADLLQMSGSDLRALRPRLQIIFQDPYSSLNPRMMAGMAILEPMMVHGIGKNARERKERVVHLLETVGLTADHYFRYPHEFSGGQRQRVCIARALAVEPQFVICDEAVSALDVSVQAQVLNLLLDLRERQNLTFIFISHDLSVVRMMSDRVMVMKDGEIVEKGNADLIYTQPRHPYTRQLIEAIPKKFDL